MLDFDQVWHSITESWWKSNWEKVILHFILTVKVEQEARDEQEDDDEEEDDDERGAGGVVGVRGSCQGVGGAIPPAGHHHHLLGVELLGRGLEPRLLHGAVAVHPVCRHHVKGCWGQSRLLIIVTSYVGGSYSITYRCPLIQTEVRLRNYNFKRVTFMSNETCQMK